MKLSYIIPAVAVALLTGCASEDVVNPQGGNGTQNEGVYAMSFNTRSSNLGRAETTTDLQEIHSDFGVWAFKGTDDADKTGATNKVMDQYLVGYTGADAINQYPDPNPSNTQTSDWYYENYGYAQGKTANSNVENQYLKYWDYSKAYTFFYAYTPYVKGANQPVFTVGATESTMEFKNKVTFGLSKDAENNNFFGATAVPKGNYGDEVAIQFKRFNAKLRIGFFEEIPGYKVEILDWFAADGTSAGADNATDNFGALAWPVTKNADNSYTLSEYVKQGTPTVKFGTINAEGKIPSTVEFASITAADKSSDVITWKAPAVANIGESFDALSYSATEYNVLPVAGMTDATAVGFRFFITYKLTSTDGSGEEIMVYNAPVFVPADYTNWAANTVYTYVFKITKNSGGTTEGDDNPDPEDPDTQALFPIIFNNLIVVAYDTPTNADIFEVSTGTHTTANANDLPTFP